MPARSKARQRAAATARAVKRSEWDKADLQGTARDMFDTMTEEEFEDFAATSHENLPDKVAGND